MENGGRERERERRSFRRETGVAKKERLRIGRREGEERKSSMLMLPLISWYTAAVS